MTGMSWAGGILDVWHWSKAGLLQTYDYHLRPDCPKCVNSQVVVPTHSVGFDIVNTVRQGGVPGMAVSGITRLAGLSGAAAIGLGAYGAHVLAAGKEGVTEEQKKAFDVANR